MQELQGDRRTGQGEVGHQGGCPLAGFCWDGEPCPSSCSLLPEQFLALSACSCSWTDALAGVESWLHCSSNSLGEVFHSVALQAACCVDAALIGALCCCLDPPLPAKLSLTPAGAPDFT